MREQTRELATGVIRLKSRFRERSLEREYQAELGPEKVRLTRILAILAMILALSFAALDLWAIPSAMFKVWSIRAVISVVLALMFLSTCLRSFQRLYPWIMVFAFAVMGGGVNVMIYLADPSEVAAHAYYGGLLLIVIGAHSLTYLSLQVSFAISTALIASYSAVAVFGQGYSQGDELVVLTAHLFVFVSTTVIGLVSQTVRDSYSRENYLLRHSLRRDVEIKDEEKRRASYLAEHDPLTGIANRLRFTKVANRMLERARETGSALMLMFLDLDQLKPINDRHGHAVGDRVLKAVAERLRHCTGPNDLVARIGGDEFVVASIVENDGQSGGAITAEQLGTAVAQGIVLRETTLHLSASIGVAGYPMDGDDLDEVLRAADAQMYVVKNRGRAGIAMTPGCQPRRLAG